MEAMEACTGVRHWAKVDSSPLTTHHSPLTTHEVRANPYLLEELLDFASVDALAMARLGLAASSPLRAQARYLVSSA